MELYFTRHGQTEWNLARRFQGREGDSPLLPRSHGEIAALGERLKEIPFKKIYASPQKRARDTALGIQAKLNQPVEILYLEGLREIGMGELEGASIDLAKETHGTALENLRANPASYDGSAFGGEPYEEMLARGKSAILEAVAAEEGPLLFVSHGAILTGCIQSLTGKSLSELRMMGGLGNNTLSILETGAEKSEPFQLKCWNDAQHLQK